MPASTRMAYCTPSQNVPRKIFYIGKRVSSASWARTDPPEGPSGLYANIWKYYFFDVGSLKSWYFHDLMVQPSCPTLSRETGRSSTNRARRGTIVRLRSAARRLFMCGGCILATGSNQTASAGAQVPISRVVTFFLWDTENASILVSSFANSLMCVCARKRVNFARAISPGFIAICEHIPEGSQIGSRK